MTYDPFIDSKKRAELIAAEEKRKLKRENEMEDLKTVLKSPEGQRVLFRIVMKTKFLESSWTGNSTTFFNEGMREVGRLLLAEMAEVAPDQMSKFFEQAFKKEIE